MTTHFPNINGNGAVPPVQPATAGNPGTWRHAHLIRQPGDPIVRHRFEFTGLSLKVREHLVNQVGTSTRDEAPRLLWLHGGSGQGKTEGCIVSALSAGFHAAVLSPGLFAGEVEGASVQALHAVLSEMVQWSAAHRCRVVVIIDDFDLSTANVKENHGATINSQLLVNEVMSLADKRHLYRNVDGSNIAFIFTVNDASNMRESLTRSGRSDHYVHAPSREDKSNIAYAVLDPKTSAERELVAALVAKYIHQPVSFWKALFLLMRALHTRRLTENGMPDKATIDRAHGQRLPLTPDIAWEAARQLRTSVVRSYLKRTGRNWLGF